MFQEKLQPILATASILCESGCRVRALEVHNYHTNIILQECVIKSEVLAKIAAITDFRILSENYKDTNIIIIRIHYENQELLF